jgi:hypothetical protein
MSVITTSFATIINFAALIVSGIALHHEPSIQVFDHLSTANIFQVTLAFSAISLALRLLYFVTRSESLLVDYSKLSHLLVVACEMAFRLSWAIVAFVMRRNIHCDSFTVYALQTIGSLEIIGVVIMAYAIFFMKK